ncbi:nucleotide-diphospho-sugar transferase [Halteromyces radiatus]|uniref:nucleotide-diphospho-sugar transferase n=1 Tax=Halteromyces radiatus TaxID=101107 RepID=UPI00221FE6C8|nr:nucleotide-diphospho-sugar transferase [Halteromyces radiatus]KAI8076742.1 nucleotide-diphospho-sugar transferase [Halteromyces radiatus]
MIWTTPLKIIYSFVISCIFVAPAIIGYILHVQLTRHSFWALGVYGLVVFSFVVLQLIFASLNRCMVAYYRRNQPDPISSSSSFEKNENNVSSSSSSCERRKASKLGLAVVGYREEPGLFAACLESIRHVEYPDPIIMVVVIDGNDPQDAEMAAVFQKIFPTEPVVTLPHLLSDLFTGHPQQLELVQKQLGLPYSQSITLANQSTHEDNSENISIITTDRSVKGENDTIVINNNNNNKKKKKKKPSKIEIIVQERQRQKLQGRHYELESCPTTPTMDPLDKFLHYYTVLPSNTRIVCYMQPHRGKRQAMYTAFRILLAVGCESIVSTDSDTKFDPRAVLELERALHWFPSIGAAAGDVRIWNTMDSALSFMSSLRYWMAFNIERAAQSFNRAVTCVSGPMGIYRASVLREILDDWVTQRFLGLECTYGDDRHLTNRVLLHGKKVVYNHMAFCETETPVTFIRWFKQQTRWSKSFYRELLWNARSLHKHSPWMAAELFYQGMYPFVLMFSIFYILWAHSPWVLLIWLVSLVMVAMIKMVYSVMVSRSLRFLAFPFYSIYYLIGLVPAKLWALISLWDVGWGTSARSASERKRENILWCQVKQSLPVVVWSCLLVAGIAFNILIYFFDPIKGVLAPRLPDPNSIVFYPNPDMIT